MAEVVEMSSQQCRDVLRPGVVGRVATSTTVGPEEVPVDHPVVDDAIILETSTWSRLGISGRDAVLALAVDLLDHGRQRGWSVLAR